MKTVFVSYYFSPANIIGAVRFTKLCKYFTKLGYQISAYASNDNKWLFLDSHVGVDSILLSDVENICVKKIGHSSLYTKLASKLKIRTKSTVNLGGHDKRHSIFSSMKTRLLYIAKKNAMFFLSIIQDIDFSLRTIRDSDFQADLKTADCIVTTYGPYSPHLVGLYAKLRYKKVKWVADFRDPIYQPSDPVGVAQFHKLIEWLVCKFCDQIVCVSSGYEESIVPSRYKNKSMVITNGFDSDDLTGLINTKQSKKTNDIFIMSYTGTTYAGRRDLTPVLRALVTLFDSSLIARENFQFHYAGPESDYIQALFEKFSLSDVLVNHGLVPRTKSLEINASSAMTVVATWDDEGHRGVLPGKLYELMMFDASILALVATSIGNSEIGKLLADTRNTYCYESNNERCTEGLIDFIAKQYQLAISNTNSAEHLAFNNYSYLEITKTYIDLIKRVVS